MGLAGTITCTVNGKCYDSLWNNQAIPTFLQRACMDRIIFMQGGAPPHISKPVIQMLKRHFRNDWIVSRLQQRGLQDHRTSILVTSGCKGYLKNIVYNVLIENLAETLRSIMGYAVY